MLQISQLDIALGDFVQLRAVTWRQYKKILEDLSPHRSTRLAYNNGRLIIMRSHTKQENDKEIKKFAREHEKYTSPDKYKERLEKDRLTLFLMGYFDPKI